MYNVSNAYKIATTEPAQTHRLTGTIGSVSFDESNIVAGSFNIQKQSTDTSDVVLGSAYIGQLTATFTGINISRQAWIGAVISPIFGLYVNNAWETVPLGLYIVKKATHTAEGVEVTAYDYMSKFDKIIKRKKTTLGITADSMWTFIDLACTKCHVILGMTKAQIDALPNGYRSQADIEIYGDANAADFANDIETYRDLLFWCAQTMGCFCTVDRAGQLIFKQYNQNIVETISDNNRLSGASFEDYTTHYTGVYFTDMDTNEDTYYGYDVAELQAQIAETTSDLEDTAEAIDDNTDALVALEEAYAQGQITEQEYLTQKAELQAERKTLDKTLSRLEKRLKWLQDALAKAQAEDDGATMDCGANPFLQYSNITKRDNTRKRVLAALDNISYTPFQCSLLCGAHYDLGDVIYFTGGHADDDICCVMSWSYTHNQGTDLQGFGVDPSQQLVKNKNAKNIKAAKKNSNVVDTKVTAVDTKLDNTPTPSNGYNTPNPTSGKTGDVYNKIKTLGLTDLNIYYSNKNVFEPLTLEKTDNRYHITLGGTTSPEAGEPEYVVYQIIGLKPETRYIFEYDLQMVGATFYGHQPTDVSESNLNVAFIPTLYVEDYRGQHGGTWVENQKAQYLYLDSEKHHYVNEFTTPANLWNDNSMFIQFRGGGIEDGVAVTFVVDGFCAAEGDTTDIVTDIYSKTNNGWAKYQIPTASTTELGGIKIGQNLSIDENGVLNAQGGGLVDDVKVDNVSVVTNKIANINTMTGATSQADGAKGLVPQPTSSDSQKYLRGDGTWQEVQGGGSGENILAPTPFIYSETEEQVGIWIDGKPLYQKTVNFGAFPNNATKTVSHNISNIDYVVTAIGYGDNGTQFFPIPFVNNDVIGSQVMLYITRSEIVARTSVDRSPFSKCYVTIQYTKTTDTAWQGGFKAYGFTPIIYSATEREVGVWKNGKPLYQKTISGTTITGGQTTNVAHNIANIDEIINSEIITHFSDNNYWRTLNFAYNAGTTRDDWLGGYAIDATNIHFQIGTAFSATLDKWYATVLYTKTTDTNGSGKYTELGVPSAHYDANEYVIGTWFGKPLYRKVFTISNSILSVHTNTWTAIPDIDDSDIKSVIKCTLIQFDPSFSSDVTVNYDLLTSTNRNYFSNKLAVMHTRNSNVDYFAGNKIIVEYTKLSD